MKLLFIAKTVHRRALVITTTLSMLLTAMLLPMDAIHSVVPVANLAVNGDFSDGVNGWQWEQWMKDKPLPGVVDKNDHAPGYAASFKMGLPDTTGQRDFYLSVNNLKRPGQSYLLTFWLKAENMPPNTGHVQLSRGYLGSLRTATGDLDFLTTGGTHDWKEYQVPIHPEAAGPFQVLFIHFLNDQMGQGTLGISGVALRVAAPEELEQIENAMAGNNTLTLPTGPNLIDNGGFEDGLNGWGYEQWDNRPVPGIIEKDDHPKDGTVSFMMGLPDATGGRWIAKSINLTQPGQGYLLTFWLKPQSLPGGAAYVRVGREGKGWLGSEEGKSDVVKIGGTHDWRKFRVPIHAKELVDVKKMDLFFYNDRMGTGTLGIAGVSLCAATEEQLNTVRPPSLEVDSFEQTLTGDTTHPTNSTFIAGQKVELIFRIAGATPQAKTPLMLLLNILDEHDQQIEAKELPVQINDEGEWQATVTAPNAKMGFYRVKAKLSDGTLLAAQGSRPAGFLTYVIVPDPAKRVDYGEDGNIFGMQGAWESEICSLLGVRWVLDDSFFWRRTEPNKAGEFGPEQVKQLIAGAKPGDDAYRVRTLPTLFVAPKWAVRPETLSYETGTLTPEGEKDWAAYCKTAANAFAAKYPDRKKHIYQITWEPIQPWGFKGTDAELIRIYEIAYKALHEADPNAIVAGPCRGLYGNGDPQDTYRLLKMGLGKYMDAFVAHPYFTATPEKDGMPQSIRDMKAALRASAGKDIPMYGSEQGLPTDEDVTKEVEQAQGLLRENLITLGEGFNFNITFVLYDYRMAGSRTGYGYYYNLDNGVPFGPKTMCPKPLAAGYATQSMLLEGSKSVGAIEWLGNTIWGYAFERSGQTTLVLWNYGSELRDVTLPTGAKQVHVIDWMGNERVVDTPTRSLTLKLGPEPVYITGVSSLMWGFEAANVLTVNAKQVKAFAGGNTSITGKVLLPSNRPVKGTLRLEPAAGSGLKALSQKISLGSAKAMPFTFKIAVPAAVRPGAYPMHLRLCDADGNTITALSLTMNVTPTVAVSMDAAFTPDGKPALAVTMVEQRGVAVNGQLDVSVKELLPGAQRGDAPMIDMVVDPGKAIAVPNTDKNNIPFRLRAGERQRVLITFPDADLQPARQYQSLVTVKTATGSTFKQTTPVHFLGAAHMTRPVTIDGDLSEWTAARPVVLGGAKDVIRSPQYYNNSLSAKLRYAWDTQNLYIAAEVDDNAFVQNRTGSGIWSQDCLQLAFNIDAKTTTGSRRTNEINVALTNKGPEAWRSLSSDLEKYPEGTLSPEQFRLAVKRVGEGKLSYEMAIPWTTLGLLKGESFKSGDAIGVAATVNDVRDGNQGDPSALGLFGGITPSKDPSKQGILTLE